MEFWAKRMADIRKGALSSLKINHISYISERSLINTAALAREA